MKLTSLFNFIALSLLTATTAHAVGAKTAPVAGEGLAECGLYYYEATLNRVESSVWSGPKAKIQFKNERAEATCGGEVVKAKHATDRRGFAGLKEASFVEAKKVQKARASLLDNRTMRVGANYKIACGGKMHIAKAIDIREAGYPFISFKFADASAEAQCGDGRYHTISDVLQNNLEVSSLGL